jgi:hypothetical protein
MIGPLWIRLTHISRSLLRLDSFIEWSRHLALCSPPSKNNFTPLWLVLFAGAGQITEASYFFCMRLHPLIAYRLSLFALAHWFPMQAAASLNSVKSAGSF